MVTVQIRRFHWVAVMPGGFLISSNAVLAGFFRDIFALSVDEYKVWQVNRMLLF